MTIGPSEAGHDVSFSGEEGESEDAHQTEEMAEAGTQSATLSREERLAQRLESLADSRNAASGDHIRMRSDPEAGATSPISSMTTTFVKQTPVQDSRDTFQPDNAETSEDLTADDETADLLPELPSSAFALAAACRTALRTENWETVDYLVEVWNKRHPDQPLSRQHIQQQVAINREIQQALEREKPVKPAYYVEGLDDTPIATTDSEGEVLPPDDVESREAEFPHDRRSRDAKRAKQDLEGEHPLPRAS